MAVLYFRKTIPKLDGATIASWSKLSYADIVKRVIKLFSEDEIPHKDVDGAFSELKILHYVKVVSCLKNIR